MGGDTPSPDPQEAVIAKQQSDIAGKEWGMKKPALDLISSLVIPGYQPSQDATTTTTTGSVAPLSDASPAPVTGNNFSWSPSLDNKPATQATTTTTTTPAAATIKGNAPGEVAAIPSWLEPDWKGLKTTEAGIYGTLKTTGDAAFDSLKSAIGKDYAPVQSAIDKYYGDALVVPHQAEIKRQGAAQKEATAGYAGLPSSTGRQMQNISAWEAGQVVNVQTVADIAKAGAEVSLQDVIAGKTSMADATKTQWDTSIAGQQATSELQLAGQQTMFDPNLRQSLLTGLASNQFGNPEQAYQNAMSTYNTMYQQQIQSYQISAQEQGQWISAFAQIGAAVATGGASIPFTSGISAATNASNISSLNSGLGGVSY
jgi:hypothetical protein